tara:strand:+ start:960 stop:1547 length:588 start_codon:yes stop_codon:yes gene_type:complete
MSTKLMPWEQLPDVWETKAQYFQWLRGQMRKAWSRHPVKNAYKMSRRVRAAVGKKTDKLSGLPQIVWALPCDQCAGTFPQNDVEVDHIIRAGSFREWAECEQWLMGLMQINFASLQLLCKPCHKVKSYAETHNLTFEDAQAEKAGIAFIKENTPKYQLGYLVTYTNNDAGDLTSVKKRRAAYVAYYKSVQGKVAE